VVRQPRLTWQVEPIYPVDLDTGTTCSVEGTQIKQQSFSSAFYSFLCSSAFICG